MTYKKKIYFKWFYNAASRGLLIMSHVNHDEFAKTNLAPLKPLMAAANILNTRGHLDVTSWIEADSFHTGA